jgi:hypothetical protein
VLRGRRRISASASAHHARDRRYISFQLRQMSQLIAATPHVRQWMHKPLASTLRHRRGLLRISVACLQRSAILSTATTSTAGHFRMMGPTITMRPDEESRFGDWRTPKGLPSDLPRRTVSRSDAKGNHSWRA